LSCRRRRATIFGMWRRREQPLLRPQLDDVVEYLHILGTILMTIDSKLDDIIEILEARV
jgi:hypothetical protein